MADINEGNDSIWKLSEKVRCQMSKNCPDLPLDEDTRGAAAQARADMALCRYQELAESENRFRELRNRERDRLKPAAAQRSESSDGISRSAQRVIENEINRYGCEGDDGSSITIVEYQHYRSHNRVELRYDGPSRARMRNAGPGRDKWRKI